MPIPSSLAMEVVELAISKGIESSLDFEGPPKEACPTSSDVIHADSSATDPGKATDAVGVIEL